MGPHSLLCCCYHSLTYNLISALLFPVLHCLKNHNILSLTSEKLSLNPQGSYATTSYNLPVAIEKMKYNKDGRTYSCACDINFLAIK